MFKVSIVGFDAILEKSKELVRTLERAGELINELNEIEVMLSGDSDSDGGDCCNSNGSCAHTCRTGD